MNHRRFAAWLLVPLASATSLAGCGGSDGGSSPTTLDAIIVTPATVTLAEGATQRFTAAGHYSDGSTQTATVTWLATGGSISSAGEYTAGSTPGDYFVIASSSGGLRDTAVVTIPAPPPPNLVAVEVTPPVVTVASGQTQSFTAVGRLSDNSTAAVPVTWTASGGSISQGGVFTAGSVPGSYQVIATEIGGAGLADTSTVTVTATLVAIEVTPSTATIATGATQQFNAVGRLSDNTTQPVTVTWTASAGTVTSAGLYTAPATAGGPHRVIATLSGGLLADTAQVTVTSGSGTIVSIAISPDAIRISPYDSVAVTAVGKHGDGSTVPVSVTWSSPAGAVSALGNFVGAPVALGSYQLVATQVGGTLADTVPVTLHGTLGGSVVGPNFWTPSPGVVYLCTSNHFTDDPIGLAATATIQATPNVGVLTPSKPYTTLGWGSNSPDGSTIDFVKVVCEKVLELPVGVTDSVKVKITVSGYSPNSGMAKVFTYQNHNNPLNRSDFTRNQDWSPPNWTTAAVAESVWVKPTDGANIWFKNTKVPF